MLEQWATGEEDTGNEVTQSEETIEDTEENTDEDCQNMTVMQIMQNLHDSQTEEANRRA